MPHVVTENCHMCRFTDCVTVCPSDAFHGDGEMLYINPDDCADCAVCVDECPVHAIYAEDDVPEDQKKWIQINAERAPGLPVVNEKADPLPGAEERKTQLGF
ncbi:MAG: ferredoxin family protein [Candidatus Latescibacterota bacterium]|nr:MAG: ferredoxin family protein [Candidatus Latescibacterota bacterium]